MKYFDGRDIMLGDQVDLGGRMTGIVVCCFQESLFSRDFPEAEWDGLDTGVMVKSEQAGLIHFTEPDVDLVLLQRAG